jgi:hypothetical protein
MSDKTTSSSREKGQGVSSQPDEVASEQVLGGREFRQAFGEALKDTLDIDKWVTGVDWEAAVARFKAEIQNAVVREDAARKAMREEVLPKLNKLAGGIKECGVYRATSDELIAIHEGVLFPGRAEAVDGTSVTFDSLPIGITQIGIAAVSYGGTSATFAQRLFRKEISAKQGSAIDEAYQLIGLRRHRKGIGQEDNLSELARRGIMTYAERRILTDKCQAPWRLGHGNPCPYELLTGSGSMELLRESVAVLRRLINEHKKFVFVPSAPNERGALTLGLGLQAGEYMILDDLKWRSDKIVSVGHYGKEDMNVADTFVKECCPSVLMGVFRASEKSPPYVFYAHREHVHIAARIAIADSILRPERGFPMLIDVADVTCRSAFGADSFFALIHDAYAHAGEGLRYLGERDTRR